MPTFAVPEAEVAGYFSVLRYVPDPLRDEAINVGLFLVDEDGHYSRFDANLPNGILRSMRRSRERPLLERWIDQTKDVFAAVGDNPLIPGQARLDRQTLESWSREFGASLRVTPPALAVGSTMEGLWNELFHRLVLPAGQQPVGLLDAPPEVSPTNMTASAERDRIASSLVKTMRTWRNFDQSRVRLHELFPGRKARHHADVAVVNGVVTAVAKALPVASGTEQDFIAARALLIDAAFDLPDDVVKLAVHGPPPPERTEMLAETQSLLHDFPNTIVVEKTRFETLQNRFAARFFPELH